MCTYCKGKTLQGISSSLVRSVIKSYELLRSCGVENAVLPEYSTEGRPEYDANGGYGGTRFIVTFHKRDPKKLISIYALYDGVNDAVFEDSPLVESSGGFTVGFVVAWFVSQSRSLVDVKSWESD